MITLEVLGILPMYQINEEKILLKLGQIAKQKGFKLSINNKVFYMKLLQFAMENPVYENGKLMVKISGSNMAKMFGIPKRTISQSIQRLVDCELIERESSNNDTFPASPYKILIK